MLRNKVLKLEIHFQNKTLARLIPLLFTSKESFYFLKDREICIYWGEAVCSKELNCVDFSNILVVRYLEGFS